MEVSLEEIVQLEKVHRYISNMRPVFNKRALFSDTTSEYLSPEEPNAYDEVTIRFRTAKNNMAPVFLVCQEKK